jgi:geranylgeranyl pyrophosphate synthase
MARRRFGNGVADSELVAISTWMQERGAFAAAEKTARDHVDQALAALSGLPDSAERDLLAQVGDFVLSRQA